MVTLRDVAEAAKVSITTASVAFTSSRPISPETRQRVLEAAKRLGYEHANSRRKSQDVQEQKGANIAYFVPSLNNPFFAGFVRGIEERLQRDLHNLIIINTEGADDRRIAGYMDMLIDSNIDGLLLTTTRKVGSIIADKCTTNRLPAVALFSPRILSGIDLVSSDDEMGSMKAVTFLIHQGFKRIAFLRVKDSSTHENRLQGYKRALLDNGLEFEPELVIESVGHDDLAAYAYSKVFLKKEIPFDAVFCCNDLMAFGLIKALRERGLRVPEDVSVVGADDTIARFMSPSLTTVRIETERMGFLAAELLLERMDGSPSTEPRTVNLPEELIIRESVLHLKRPSDTLAFR
ncbi:MAG: LacI family transcriptional regulator [Firmicutes bacterium]|nr:LacI family transcriptional regulator [Bacillota bacterium]